MKKILSIILLSLFLTGCSATYNINFTDDKIKDEIRVYTDSNTVNNATNDTINSFSNKILEWERGHDHYSREVYTTDTLTGYLYKYDFNYDEYDAMSQIRKCYEDFDLTYNNQEITLKTSNKFLCKEYYEDVSDLTLTITTDKTIISSNADTKNSNTHTWYINKKNYNNKPLEIKISRQSSQKEQTKKKIDIKHLLVIILFILLIIVYIINKKEAKKKKK